MLDPTRLGMDNLKECRKQLLQSMIGAKVQIVRVPGDYRPEKDTRRVTYVPLIEYGIGTLMVQGELP